MDTNNTKPNIFKGRTKEWDSNEWQGRSKQQVENNEFISMVSVMGLIGLSIIMAVINYI